MGLDKTFCPAVAIYDSSFTQTDRYYRMFPHEMTERKIWGLDIQERRPLPHITFQGVLETMRDSLRAHPSWDHFLIVAHGLHDRNDVAFGLTMPIAPKCSGKTTMIDILRPLLGFLNNNTSRKEIDDFEHNNNLLIDNAKPKLARGSLAAVVDLMRELRPLKVRSVEFRACALGTTPDVLEVLGRCFSSLWVAAPDVHMFYAQANPGRPVSATTLQHHLRAHPGARVFPKGGDSFAFQIQGRGASRASWAETTTGDLTWFVDQFIWEGSSYPRVRTNHPASFVIAGMDLNGAKRFALPQEPEYAQHLIYKGPLPGNQI